MPGPQTLNILLLSDGLPGHVNQSRGLVSWLSERYCCEVTELDISLRMKPLSRVMLPHLLHEAGWGAAIVPYFYAKSSLMSLLPSAPNLILSAGGNTSFLNVALARRWRVPNVFLGSKRRLRSDDFAAHLTLEPTGEPHNIVMLLAPTLINPQHVARKGHELRLSLGVQSDEKLSMLAVGGDGAGCRYDSEEVEQLVQLMVQEYQCKGRRWLLTTSRRTGKALEQKLKKNIPAELLVDSVWWSESPRKVMAAYMGAADHLFVTADSMSMIAEAIASNKPTMILQPKGAQPEARYREALQRFERSGLCRLAVLGQPIDPAPVVSNAFARAKEALLDELTASLGLSADP